MSENNETEHNKTPDSAEPRSVPETIETEPGSARTEGPTVHDYSSAEMLAQEGIPSGEEEMEKDALRNEIDEMKDKMLRAVAEAENVRRRAEREKADAAKFGITRLARDLMGVADNFERALASIPPEVRENAGENVQNLITGLEMTDRELINALEKNGIQRIEPKQEDRFDPNFHQAVAEIPASGQPGGTVVHLTQTGYVLDDRVLRPAMVTVASSSQNDPGQEGEKEGTGEQKGPGSTLNTTA